MIDFQKTAFQKFIAMIRPRWAYAHFWYDLRYDYWTSARHKRQLLKNQNFCTWNIVDSIADLTFRQFELFWIKSGRDRFDNPEYLAMCRKDQRNWYDSIITQKKIFAYISDIRKYNQQHLKDIQSEQWNYVRDYFVPSGKDIKGEEYYTMETDYLEGYFEITFSFDKDDRLKIKKTKPSGKNRINILLIDNKLRDLDDKYLKMIIDNRQYMWD